MAERGGRGGEGGYVRETDFFLLSLLINFFEGI
jgi:hypothetical protein